MRPNPAGDMLTVRLELPLMGDCIQMSRALEPVWSELKVELESTCIVPAKGEAPAASPPWNWMLPPFILRFTEAAPPPLCFSPRNPPASIWRLLPAHVPG